MNIRCRRSDIILSFIRDFRGSSGCLVGKLVSDSVRDMKLIDRPLASLITWQKLLSLLKNQHLLNKQTTSYNTSAKRAKAMTSIQLRYFRVSHDHPHGDSASFIDLVLFRPCADGLNMWHSWSWRRSASEKRDEKIWKTFPPLHALFPDLSSLQN